MFFLKIAIEYDKNQFCALYLNLANLLPDKTVLSNSIITVVQNPFQKLIRHYWYLVVKL